MRLRVASTASIVVLTAIGLACSDEVGPTPPGGPVPDPATDGSDGRAPPIEDDRGSDGGVGLGDASPIDDAGGPDASDASPSGGVRVIASEPAEGSSTYAFEMVESGASWARKKRVRLEFDSAMNTSIAALALNVVPGGGNYAFSGVWSADALVLEAELPLLYAGGRPLEYQKHYAVDLSALRDAQGRGVDAAHGYLGDGALDFTTMARDALLEHTCLHTFDAPQPPLGLSVTPEAGLAVGTPHLRYVMVLPDGAGPRVGHATWQVFGAGTQQRRIVFLRDDVPLTLRGPNGAPPATAPAPYPVPRVCALVKAWDMVLENDVPYTLSFGPTEVTPIEVFFEAAAL